MRLFMLRPILTVLVLNLLSTAVFAGRLECPDFVDNSHRREIVAGSAPEIKVRKVSVDSARWPEIIRPLIRKATKEAKAQRTMAIAQDVDNACTLPKHYVAQTIPFPHYASGCSYRILTRPADDEHLWVQAIVTCRYDWACCTSNEPNFFTDDMMEVSPDTEPVNSLTPGTTTAVTPSKPHQEK